MRECTRAYLAELSVAPVLENVGKDDLDQEVLRVTTWAKAARLIDTKDNDNIRIDAQNDFIWAAAKGAKKPME